MPASSPHPSGPFLPGEILVIFAAQLSGTVLSVERPQPLQEAAAWVPYARVQAGGALCFSLPDRPYLPVRVCCFRSVGPD